MMVISLFVILDFATLVSRRRTGRFPYLYHKKATRHLTYPPPEKQPDVIIGSEKYYHGNGLKLFLWTYVFQNNLIFSIS